MRSLSVGQRLVAMISRDALAPEYKTLAAQWIEVIVISVGAVGLAWWAAPNDPALTQQRFPWLLLAPVLVALRYGVLPSLISSSLIVGNVLLAWKLGRLPESVSEIALFGGVLLVMLCGEFSDVWRDRNQRMEETYLYMSERVAGLTKRHLLLNLSHDRLEQEMLARPGSVRDALVRLRALALDAQSDEPMPGAQGLLQLLSQYVNIESAQIYLLEPREDSYVLGRSVASVGESEPMAAEDGLLALALERCSLAHIASDEASLLRNTSQLVVAPLIAGDQHMVGVLAVTRMPFFSLTVENLQLMLVMLGYYADNLRSSQDVADMQKRLPNVPVLFAQELARLLHLHQRVGLPSHIVVMRFAGPRGKEIPEEFLRVKRGLDLYWLTYAGEVPILAVLMPFARSAAKDGFLSRIESWLQGRYHGSLESLQIEVTVADFDQPDVLGALAQAVGGL